MIFRAARMLEVAVTHAMTRAAATTRASARGVRPLAGAAVGMVAAVWAPAALVMRGRRDESEDGGSRFAAPVLLREAPRTGDRDGLLLPCTRNLVARSGFPPRRISSSPTATARNPASTRTETIHLHSFVPAPAQAVAVTAAGCTERYGYRAPGRLARTAACCTFPYIGVRDAGNAACRHRRTVGVETALRSRWEHGLGGYTRRMPVSTRVHPRRPLPATERGRRSRAAIVESAAKLMYENGVAATSVDDVLAAAGCGKSQMYHYFDDKADLIRAVISRQVELVLAAQQDTLERADTWDGLQAWKEHVIATHSRRGGPFACPLGTMASELDNDKAFRPALNAAFRRWEAPLTRGLQVMRDRGELVADADPARLAILLIAALQGGILLARVRKDVTILRDTLEGAFGRLERSRTTSAARPKSSRRGRS